jgi:hypothetical protein
MPTSCSRTRIVAVDLSVTVQVAVAAVVAAAVGVAVAVGVGVAAEGVAAPLHAATKRPAARADAIERACMITG